MTCALTSLPTEVILRICNETQSHKPMKEGIIRMSETCSRLRAIALPLIFRNVVNWKKGPYTDGAWPSTVWPYIQVVTVYDTTTGISHKLFKKADLLTTLPSLVNVNHILLDIFSDAPDLLGNLTLPFLITMATLPRLETLSLRQYRFDGPSLTQAIAQMHQLTCLTLTVSSNVTRRLELQQYSHFAEVKNIAGILRTLAPVLRRLEISGDLIDFQMIEWTEWPRLSTLRLVGHVPYSSFRPIAAVVSRMPMLQTLACDFKAEETPRPSFIFCPSYHCTHLLLSTVCPDLISLSISNLQSGDQIVRQLPSGLRDLRVVALRDIHILSIGNLTLEPRYHYSALSDSDASIWINVAAELPHLSKLTLHLKSIPSPEILQHIARACPKLQYLELEQASFEHNRKESSDSMLELLTSPLASLLQLRELRLSVELGPSLVWVEGFPKRLPSQAFEARVKMAGTLFASRLRNLQFLGFSALSRNRVAYGRDVIWYMFKIIGNEEGLSIQMMDPI